MVFIYLAGRGNGIRGSHGLHHSLGETGDQHEDEDGQERGHEGGDGERHGAVLGRLDDHGHQQTDQVHPREGGGKAEAGDESVEGLGFDLSGNILSNLHYVYYSGRKSFSSTIIVLYKIFS